MPAQPDKALMEIRRRDAIADGDAARKFARSSDLSRAWILELLKRLLVELERTLKAIEDHHAAGTLRFNEHAAAIAQLMRIFLQIANLPNVKALLAEAEEETDGTPELTALARRFHSLLIEGEAEEASVGDVGT